MAVSRRSAESLIPKVIAGFCVFVSELSRRGVEPGLYVVDTAGVRVVRYQSAASVLDSTFKLIRCGISVCK